MPHAGAVEPLRVACIIGSTREGRAGAGVARWFAEKAGLRDDLALSVIDLAEFDFPAHYPECPTPEISAFTAELGVADAFVLVTPEYNRSFPAALKQAIDFGYDEWHAKAVGFVSYGCGSDGIHAVEQLRSVFTELQAVTVRDRVAIDLLECDEKSPAPGSYYVDGLLDQLVWWGLALREARALRPYVS